MPKEKKKEITEFWFCFQLAHRLPPHPCNPAGTYQFSSLQNVAHAYLTQRGIGIWCLYSTLRHQNGNLYSFFPHQYSISLYKNVLFNQILQIQLYSPKLIPLLLNSLCRSLLLLCIAKSPHEGKTFWVCSHCLSCWI